MCEMCLKEPCDPRCPSFHEYRVGRCETCGVMVMDTDERWKDADDHLFCSSECAMDFYGIKEVRA